MTDIAKIAAGLSKAQQHSGDCHCPRCMAEFADWLEKRNHLQEQDSDG